MTKTEDITLVTDAIHNPKEPRHFMQLVKATGSKTASIDGTVIARSNAATIVKEVGHNVYDAVVYFPRSDITMPALVGIDKTTHCPLKGDTEYFDIVADGARLDEAAWSYVEMISGDGLDGLEALKGLVAFDTSKVTVT